MAVVTDRRDDGEDDARFNEREAALRGPVHGCPLAGFVDLVEANLFAAHVGCVALSGGSLGGS